MRHDENGAPCPACGFIGPANMRFCGVCGQSLQDATPRPIPAEPPPARRRAPRASAAAKTAERRQLTVMFCDLAGSTRLSGQLDPEDLTRVLLSYRDACVAAVERYGGTVARFLGDGILIYFGYPTAHEDDPRRAIRAALGVLERMAILNERLMPEVAVPLAVRIGIHTGIVIVGDLRTDHHTEAGGVMGETPNIAAKLQSLAAPDEIIVSDETRRLAEHHFRFEARPEGPVPGVERLLRTHLVLGEASPRDRPASQARRAPMVARERELAALLQTWQEVCEGRAGRVVAVEGEAGIGKSRLVSEFLTRIGDGADSVVMQCAADATASAFQPVIAWLGTLIEAAPQERASARQRAEAVLAAQGLADPLSVAAIAVMLGLATEAEQAEFAANPRRKRRRLVDAVVRLILARAARGPLVLLLEDLQWADNSTLTLLRLCLERAVAMPLLVLITARDPVLADVAQVQRLPIERLSEEQSYSLVRGLYGKPIAKALLKRIVERTDGVPLFIEEVTWTATHQPRPAAQPQPRPAAEARDDIPMTLGHSLMARLDQVSEARPVAQVAAVLGRSFRIDLIAAVLAEEPAARLIPLTAALEQLSAARFIEATPAAAQSTYRFRHALIQEAAYGTLMRDRWQDYHRRIADLLLHRFSHIPEARAETIARHYAAAGRAAEAIWHFRDAAEQAARMAANVEAVQHYQAALALLEQDKTLAGRDEAEVGLQIRLAAQLVIARGNAAPEVERALERARGIADGIGNTTLRFRALRHLQTYHMVRGNIPQAHDISSELRAQALRAADPDILLQVHRPHGLCLLYLGRFAQAREELLRTLELYDPGRHENHRFEYGSDPAVLARAHLGWVEWFAGEADLAHEYGEAAVAAARRLQHPHSLCFALAFRSCLAQFGGDPRHAQDCAQEMGRLSDTHDYLYWAAWANILEGWSVFQLGARERGEQQLRDGLADYVATGAGLLRPYALSLLADCLSGQTPQEALQLLDEAIIEAEAKSILFWHRDMLRLRERLRGADAPVVPPAPVHPAASTL